MAESEAVTSETLRARSEIRKTVRELCEYCDIVVSVPATFFLAGERGQLYGAPATCMRVPRRLYVGLKQVKRGTSPQIKFKSSHVTLQTSKGFSITRWPGQHSDLSNPLVAAATGFRVLRERDLRSDYELHVYSEYQGDYGLGWSGAFSAALASALLFIEGEIHNPAIWPFKNPIRLKYNQEFDATMRLGWCVEAVFHNGRASASSVCGSLLGTGLPYMYSATEMPKLWDTTVRAAKKASRCANTAAFIPFRQARYSFEYLVAGTNVARDRDELEREIARRLFTTRDLLIVHTNVPKSTAESTKFELNAATWIHRHLNRKSHYAALVETCKAVSLATRQVVTMAAEDPEHEDLYQRWDDLCALVTRVQGLLMSLGFNFPVGDEVLGKVFSFFSGTQGFTSIGGKLTGGGRGGNLVFVAQAKTIEKLLVLERTIEKLREEHTVRHKYTNWPESQICILYSARRDGIETEGPKVELR